MNINQLITIEVQDSGLGVPSTGLWGGIDAFLADHSLVAIIIALALITSLAIWLVRRRNHRNLVKFRPLKSGILASLLIAVLATPVIVANATSLTANTNALTITIDKAKTATTNTTTNLTLDNDEAKAYEIVASLDTSQTSSQIGSNITLALDNQALTLDPESTVAVYEGDSTGTFNFDVNVAVEIANSLPVGTYQANINYQVVYDLTPTIASITPDEGPTTGGTFVTITGTNFIDNDNITSVTIGTETCVIAEPSDVTDTTITCTTPAGTEGAKDVVVTTEHGSATAENAFTYTIPAIPAMQAFTTSDCDAMPIYDKDTPNEASTTVLKDTRNDQLYTIRRLQDGNCWMITNLKIGSTTATTTLTSDDTDLNSIGSNPNIIDNAGTLEFTLPQITPAESGDYSTPYAFGPVTGDSSGEAGSESSNAAIDDATFYGYLYTWPAASAGETQSSITTGDAPNSICPKGWRLPTGGNNTGDLAYLNADMAGIESPSKDISLWANWINTGSFRGVLSGNTNWESFSSQNWTGDFWSSTANGQYYVYHLNINYDEYSKSVYTYTDIGRNRGLGARCLVR
jgi:uncharacterized protein (TIGR02145 family)